MRIYGKRIRVRNDIAIEADVKRRTTRKRPRIYDERVLKALRKIWRMMNYICGSSRPPVLEELIIKLQEHMEIDIDEGRSC